MAYPPGEPDPSTSYLPGPSADPWPDAPFPPSSAPPAGPWPPRSLPATLPLPGGYPPPAPVPARSERAGSRRGLLIGLSVVLALLLCGGGTAIALLNHNGQSAGPGGTRNAAGSSPTAGSTSTGPTTPSTDGGSTGSGSTGTGRAAAVAVGAWAAGGGKTRLDALMKDFDALRSAGQATDPAAVRTACGSLQRDVESAQAYRPIPDGQAQQHWAAALAQFARAATDCVAGVDTTNPDLLNRAAGELTQGAAEANQVSDRMKALTG